MSSSLHNVRLEESLETLRSIVARRNELLRELFRMMQSKGNFSSVLLDAEQDDQNLGVFLQRFDLSSDFDQGSIRNLREDETWHLERARQPHLPSPSSDIDMGHAFSPSTRGRSHIADAARSLSPATAFHTEITSEEASIPQVEVLRSTSASSHLFDPRPIDGRGGPTETSDEDNDELDLIGSSALSVEGGRNLVRRTAISPVGSSDTVSPTEAISGLPPTESLPYSPLPESSLCRQSLTGAPVDDEEKASADEFVQESAPKTSFDFLPGDNKQASGQSRTLDLPVVPINGAEKDALPAVEDSTSCGEISFQRQNPTQQGQGAMARISSSLKTEDAVHEAALSSAVQGKMSVPQDSLRSAQVHIPLPPSIQETILIPTPMTALKRPSFNLDIDHTAEYENSQISSDKADTRHHFDPRYTIPSLDVLPAEFSRKVRPAKLRKRDKNGEKDSKRERDENVPLGLHRWNAVLTANPVWRKVSRASKCLSTRDWGVAMTELRLIRAIQRIDQLKEEGRWSFRQPKKQRGVGGLIKTHWDYLLDEMRWMRIDFREERRWKIALAYNLSTAVLEWHLAKTPEERRRMGICVKWRPSGFGIGRDSTPESIIEDTEQAQLNSRLLGISYGSDDEDGREHESRNVVNSLEPSTMIEDALMEPTTDLRPKNEEVDDQTAIQLLRQGVDETVNSQESSRAGTTAVRQTDSGLKSTSNDPLLAGTKSSSQSTNGDVETVDPSVSDLKSNRTALAPFRGQIAYSQTDQLFVATNSDTHKDDTYQASEELDSMDIRTLFPELQPLSLLDVSTATLPTDGKRKVEKRSDRDDPNKRTEDTTYTKLYPTGRFMYAKPTLIGPLQPSKRWKDGKWSPLEQTPVAFDTEFNTRISEDNISDLFDGRANISNYAFPLQTSSFKDKEGKRDSSAHAWSAADDALLRSLIDKYSTNWPLIADCFNSSRLSTLTDRRSAADCLQRWKERWGSERRVVPSETAQTSNDAASSANAQMTTRGVKRMASSSVSSPTSASAAANTEMRKRRRHLLLHESIRKAGKKRAEAAQKVLTNQRKPPQVHETHNQYNKLPRLSPAELSRMKAERDLQNNQDIALARKRQDEQIRQTLLLREQAQRGTAQIQPQSSQGQQPQAAQQSQPSAPSQQLQQQQLAQQQLAQLQQLQQQANQNTRSTVSTAVLPSRPVRLTTAANPRQASQQPQVLQQQRSMPGPSSNAVHAPASNVAHASGNSFYGLPSNVTQEQFLMAIQTAQQQQQQQQQQGQSLNNLGVQPP